MTVFTWNGEQDTTFSTIDSIKYYAKILNTGMMTLEPSTGKIKVWIGGIDHRFFNYDHVNQSNARRVLPLSLSLMLQRLDNGFTPAINSPINP
jgi:penicillin-binding protein 1A